MATSKKAPTQERRVRRFEFVDERSAKFWEIKVTAKNFEVHYGRIGTSGQTQLKAFDDAAAARNNAEKLIAEKLKGGYIEQEPTASNALPSKAKPVAPKSTPVKLTQPAKKSAKEVNTEPVEAANLTVQGAEASNKNKRARAKQGNSISPTEEITIRKVLEKIRGKQISNQDSNIPKIPPMFKVSRSPSVLRQIAEASKLKSALVMQIKEEFPLAFVDKTSYEHKLLRTVELSNESFDAIVAAQNPNQVDRTASMLPGPFFTSEAYPIPVGKNGKAMTPIVQVDLCWASKFIDERLGNDLVQVWYDRAKFEGYLRVIPRKLLNISNMTEFELKIGKRYNTFPVPYHWESYLQGGNVTQIVGVISRGIRSQTSSLEMYREGSDFLRERLSSELIKSLKTFEKITRYEFSGADAPVGFGGTFYPIQYSAVDANRPCLLVTSGDWGASGGAQIFYNISPEGLVDFSFWDCLR